MLQETDARQEAKGLKKRYVSTTFENGNTRKELLAKNRYLLFKSVQKWTESQKFKGQIPFEKYPNIEWTYSLSHSLSMISNKRSIEKGAKINLARWYNDVEESGFNTIAATLYNRSDEILIFYVNRLSNATAEFFNAKIKQFRA